MEEDRGKKDEDEQRSQDERETGEENRRTDPTGTSGDDGDLLLFAGGTITNELPCAIDGPAETVGHAQEEHAIGGNQDDRTDGELQRLDEVARFQGRSAHVRRGGRTVGDEFVERQVARLGGIRRVERNGHLVLRDLARLHLGKS